MGVRQVPPKPWPSGDSRPIAVLPFELPELTARYGLDYEDGVDDLDRFGLAAIELADGQQAWLYKHDGDPNPGIVVRVDARADPDEAKRLLLDALGLDCQDLWWAGPEPVPAGQRQ